MKKLLAAMISTMAVTSAFAQTAATPVEVKSPRQSRAGADQGRQGMDEALIEQARANMKADAKANNKKLKTRHKVKKQIDDAAADLSKAQNKADVEAAKADK